jgi:glycosidase
MHASSIVVAALAFGLMLSCSSDTENHSVDLTDTAITAGHPAWILQGNIYEVNTRQYTPEGTFKAFESHLSRLKEMGVQTLWFMPINPISKVDRKGKLGSYYAISDYTAINEEYGTLADWKALVDKCHALGFKVIIDWVPNHTGGDHGWLTSHPDFYVRDSVTGKAVSQYDWTDTRKLNYQNEAMQDSMIASMAFWITETDIDGFRCDVAGEVPDAFWQKCIPLLKKFKNIFMLAEGDKPSLAEAGFDATYGWPEFAIMKKIAKGEEPASALDMVRQKTDSIFPTNKLVMYFTSNHDENSWNKADYGTMPGDIHAPFAVLTQTIGNSIPLIYSGQEEPFLDSLSFFYKDTIRFGSFNRASFYQTLLELRNSNDALSGLAPFKKLVSSRDDAIYAYERIGKNGRLLVVLNLSAKPVSFTLQGTYTEGTPTNIFTKTIDTLASDRQWQLPAWGYELWQW